MVAVVVVKPAAFAATPALRLRLLMERDRMMEARLQELRGEVSEGLEQARRGDLVAGDEVRERLRRKTRERSP